VSTLLRVAVLAFLVISPAAFAQAFARGEGLLVRIEPGYLYPSLDAERIQRQAPVPPGEVKSLLGDQTPAAPGMSLVLGYNIKGHATAAVAVSATGWDLDTDARGGAGFAGLELSWHPLQLFPSLAQRRLDASAFGGAGYFVLGEQRALNGLQFQAGLRVEYFVTPWLSMGGALRYISLQGSEYITDWTGNVRHQLPEGSGGSMLIPSLTLAVHAPIG
jgi:hypothetical protein